MRSGARCTILATMATRILHPSVARVLSHFRYEDPRDPKTCARFAALARKLALRLDGPEVTIALQSLLVARDWALRADEASDEKRQRAAAREVNDVSELLDDEERVAAVRDYEGGGLLQGGG